MEPEGSPRGNKRSAQPEQPPQSRRQRIAAAATAAGNFNIDAGSELDMGDEEPLNLTAARERNQQGQYTSQQQQPQQQQQPSAAEAMGMHEAVDYLLGQNQGTTPTGAGAGAGAGSGSGYGAGDEEQSVVTYGAPSSSIERLQRILDKARELGEVSQEEHHNFRSASIQEARAHLRRLAAKQPTCPLCSLLSAGAQSSNAMQDIENVVSEARRSIDTLHKIVLIHDLFKSVLVHDEGQKKWKLPIVNIWCHIEEHYTDPTVSTSRNTLIMLLDMREATAAASIKREQHADGRVTETPVVPLVRLVSDLSKTIGTTLTELNRAIGNKNICYVPAPQAKPATPPPTPTPAEDNEEDDEDDLSDANDGSSVGSSDGEGDMSTAPRSLIGAALAHNGNLHPYGTR